MFRRIVFVVLIAPAAVLDLFFWVFTGKDFVVLTALGKWARI